MAKIKDTYQPTVEFDFRLGTYQDLSANAFAATLTPDTSYWMNSSVGRCFNFTGGAAINLGNHADIDNTDTFTFTFLFNTKYTVGSQTIASKTDNGTFKGWALYLNGGSDIMFRMYQNGFASGIKTSAATNYNDGKWHFGVVTYDGSGTEAGVKIYVDGVSQVAVLNGNSGFTGSTLNTADWVCGEVSYGGVNFNGCIAYFAQYSNEFTSIEASQVYTDWLKEAHYNLVDINHLDNRYDMFDATGDDELDVYISDGMGWNESKGDIASGLLEDTDWNISTGTWQADDVDNGKKEITNIGAGIIYKDTRQAYGTWEFDFIKGAGTSINFMLSATEIGSPLATSQDGYQVLLTAAENVQIWLITNGATIDQLYSSSLNVFTPTQWHRLKITRAAGGVFSIYIDDELLDADLTGSNPFTENTHTVSAYFNLDLDAGDSVKNFKFTPYVD